MKKPIRRSIALAAIAVALLTTEASSEIREVEPGDTLTRLAIGEYGDGRAWPAIMFATNSRLSELEELDFIGDPNALAPGQRVWIPDQREKDRWIENYRAYVAAVVDMSLPQPWEVSRRLVEIPADRPARVVTWARSGQFSPGASTASRSIWVTVVPHLRDFCRALPDRDRLVPRLEQRLGMPPASNKTEFVEIEVERPAEALFRPCADPRIDTTTCPLGPPGDDAPAGYHTWFLNQYFASYAQAHPTRFPWTSLGYTYDWGDPRSEEGESEFIIRAGAEIEVVSITPTEDYCLP